MTNLIAKIFIKNCDNINNPQVRKSYGTLAGVFGIVMNLILCSFKLIAGLMTGAISVTADAVNNLTDAGSSVITLIGTRLAAKKPDPDHPFGHGRIEYITGLIVSFVIILLGFELLTSSISKIFSPKQPNFSTVSVVILSVSVLIKLYMWSFTRTLGRKISSTALFATATDCWSDCIATSAVLFGLLLFRFFGINIDGYIGVAVAVFIMISGVKSAKDTIDPLLGNAPDKGLIDGITKTVLSYDTIIGIHDLIVHDYGPGRLMISLHAEVPSNIDITLAHDTIDTIEVHLNNEFNCESTIHMDPIDVDDERTNSLKSQVESIVKSMDARMHIHDFRITATHFHTNLIFDVVIPHDFELSASETIMEIKSKIHDIDESYFAVIKVDYDYAM